MARIVNWGILGASRFARGEMAPAIHLARGARLAALATRSPEKAQEFRDLAPDIEVFDSYEDLLSAPGIDAVYIPLPNSLHVPWAIRALEAGKAALIEKPAAMNVTELDRLIAASARAGLPAHEAFMIAHHPQWAQVRALIEAHEIGELVQVTGHFSYFNDNPADIRNQAETGGGALRDVGVYPLGAARLATSAQIEAPAARLTRQAGVDTHAIVEARLGPAALVFTVSMRMMRDQQMSFHGTRGTIRLGAPFNPGRFAEAELVLARPDHSEARWRWPGVNQYVAQVEAFGRTLTTGAPFCWSLEDARATQAVLDALLT